MIKSYLGIIPKYLKLNKRRMIFTILGIILSISLMTTLAILADGNSAGNAERIAREKSFYHVQVGNLTQTQLEALSKTPGVEKLGVEKRLGDYTVQGQNTVIVGEFLDEAYIEMFKIRVTSGKLPASGNQILLNESIVSHMSPRPNPGDTITLKAVNSRYIEVQQNENGIAIHTPKENNAVIAEMDFVITGFFDSDFYPMQNVGIMSSECPEEIKNGLSSSNTYIKFKPGVAVKQEIARMISFNLIGVHSAIDYNDELLVAIGQAIDWGTLGFQLIFSIIIGLATIAAIYNIFYISVIERIRHYGTLRSLGASPRQIRRLVISEGLLLCLIAVPLGLGLGILMAWLLHIYAPDVISGSAIFVIRWGSLLLAALVGCITVFFSTLKPALTAGKISPIEAISNTGYKITCQNIKVRKWHTFLSRIFGISCLLAYRNLWRNKKKFLVTAFSMCLCCVMFIVFSYFLSTIYHMVEKSYKVPMDFSVNAMIGQNQPGLNESDYKKIMHISDIKKIEKLRFIDFAFLERNKELFTDNFKRKQNYISDRYNLRCSIVGVENGVLEKSELKAGSISDVLKGTNSAAIISNWPANQKKTGLLQQFKIGEELKISIWDSKTNSASYYTSKVGAIISNSSEIWSNDGGRNDIQLVFSNDNFIKIFGDQDYRKFNIYTSANTDNNKVENELNELFKNDPNYHTTYFEKDYQKSIQQGNQVKAFYLGLIGILSLIGIFNIFNSISAGLILRTREYSTLKAIGMSHRQLAGNMALEGLLHGIISSLWGSLIGIGITYLIYRIIDISQGNLSWQLPWLSILIATLLNITVCILATLAPLRRIGKLDIIEGIRTLD